MGYQRSLLRLKFENSDFDGLEVTCRRMPVEDLFQAMKLAESGDSIAERKAALEEVFPVLARGIVEWNLESEQGKPVMIRPETFASLDLPFIRAILDAWMDASAGVSRPLSTPSKDGDSFPEGSIPMETLSASPLS